MKINHPFTFTLMLLWFAAPSMAAESGHYYVKPYTGISYMNDVTGLSGASPVAVELEKGMTLGAAFGYRYNANIAAEVSWEYRTNDSETRVGNEFYPAGNYASNLLYLNGIYYFSSFGDVTPYAGVGVGWIQEIDIDLERNGVETSYSNSGNFSFQGFAGVEYRLNSRWTLHTELRHAGAKSGRLQDEQTKIEFASLDYKPFTWQFGASFQF
jgi:opacity protein-like surface antigen